jgi:hypothetical protein
MDAHTHNERRSAAARRESLGMPNMSIGGVTGDMAAGPEGSPTANLSASTTPSPTHFANGASNMGALAPGMDGIHGMGLNMDGIHGMGLNHAAAQSGTDMMAGHGMMPHMGGPPGGVAPAVTNSARMAGMMMAEGGLPGMGASSASGLSPNHATGQNSGGNMMGSVQGMQAGGMPSSDNGRIPAYMGMGEIQIHHACGCECVHVRCMCI